MEVEDLRAALRDAGERVPVDVDAGRHAVARRRRRRHVAGWVAAVVLVAAAATVVVLAWPGGSSGPSVSTPPPRRGLPLGDLPAIPVRVVFRTPSHGVGLTSSCTAPPTADAVCDLGVLATRDGGRTWVLVGARRRVVYAGWRGFPFLDLAVEGNDVWVYGTRTFVSHDGGHTLRDSRVGRYVVSLAPGHRDVWALVRTCPPSQGCATTLVSAPRGSEKWRPIDRAPALVDPYVSLLRPTEDAGYLLTRDAPQALYRTDDGGRSWRQLNVPRTTLRPVALDARGSDHLWLATGSASPTMEQDKELYRSDDAGTRWTLVATTAPSTNIGQLPRAGLIHTLTVVTPDRLWLDLDFANLTGSTDAGRTWFATPVGGAPTGTDVIFLDATHGWAATYGSLSRTTDGVHWTQIGAQQ